MGQYLQIGILYEATIPKQKRRYRGAYTTTEILNELSKNIDLNLFDIEDDEEYVSLSIKKEILLDNIKAFIIEQRQFMNDEEIDLELLSLLEQMNYEALVKEVESKYYCDLQVMEDQTWYLVNDLDTVVDFKAMGYFLVGKAYMECYRSLLSYMMNLIKQTSSNVLKDAIISEFI